MTPPDGDSTPDPRTRSREDLIPYVAIVAVPAGLLFGVDPGVISGALDHIGPSSRLADFGTEAVVPSVLLAGFAFVGFLVPEAEGHALEEIQEAFVARANRSG